MTLEVNGNEKTSLLFHTENWLNQLLFSESHSRGPAQLTLASSALSNFVTHQDTTIFSVEAAEACGWNPVNLGLREFG